MESTTPRPSYVGLDVSKDRLDYTLDGTTVAQVPNTSAGQAALLKVLTACVQPRVVCEASGGYERALVVALLQAGVEVCVVQPGRVRAFAQAEGLLAKTDQLDARLLRRFGQQLQPRLQVPASPAATVLRELLDHRRQLTDQRVAVESRLSLAGPVMTGLLRRQLEFLAKQLAAVEKLIAEQIDRDPDLRQKSRRLQELAGVGPVLAATLLAYVPELGQVESPRLAALVGVAPYARDSGSSQRPRHVRGGRGAVRHVLYMAAVAATQYNPVLRAFYERLRAKGKPAKVALVAVMRRMLAVLNRLIADPKFQLAN